MKTQNPLHMFDLWLEVVTNPLVCVFSPKGTGTHSSNTGSLHSTEDLPSVHRGGNWMTSDLLLPTEIHPALPKPRDQTGHTQDSDQCWTFSLFMLPHTSRQLRAAVVCQDYRRGSEEMGSEQQVFVAVWLRLSSDSCLNFFCTRIVFNSAHKIMNIYVGQSFCKKISMLTINLAHKEVMWISAFKEMKGKTLKK